MLHKIVLLLFAATSIASAFITLDPPVIGKHIGWDGEVSLSGEYNTGNSDKTSAGLSIRADYSSEKWLFLTIAAYNYGESNGNKDTDDGLLHLRYIHHIDNTLYDYEFFVQTEYNEFQDIRIRNLVGANIRREIPDYFDACYVGMGLFYSYMEPDVISPIDPVYERVKLNTYLSLTKQVNANFTVTYLGFYQPNIEDFSDYRIVQTLQFDTTITDHLTLGIDLRHKYNATPYHQIERSDFKSGINLKYQWK